LPAHQRCRPDDDKAVNKGFRVFRVFRSSPFLLIFFVLFVFFVVQTMKIRMG